MRPNELFLRLLIGALSLTNVRSLEGHAALSFMKTLAGCKSIEEVIEAIKSLPEQRLDAHVPLRMSPTHLLLQGSRISINLKSVGSGCELRIRLRKPTQTSEPDAECNLSLNEAGGLNVHQPGKSLQTFLDKARGAGGALEAEVVTYWLKDFGLIASENLSSNTLTFATAPA